MAVHRRNQYVHKYLIAREFSVANPEMLGGERNYRIVCSVAGLDPVPGGYGLLHCTDNKGRRVTVATSDIEYHQLLIARTRAGDPRRFAMLTDDRYPFMRDGWPDDWANRPVKGAYRPHRE